MQLVSGKSGIRISADSRISAEYPLGKLYWLQPVFEAGKYIFFNFDLILLKIIKMVLIFIYLFICFHCPHQMLLNLVS